MSPDQSNGAGKYIRGPLNFFELFVLLDRELDCLSENRESRLCVHQRFLEDYLISHPLIISRARKTADWDLQGGSAKRSPWVVIVKLCDPIRTTKRSSWPLDDTKSSPFFYFYAAISDGV